ncbi:MAG: hypothetical protein ACK55Z_18180 [bacterium]
MSRCPLAYGIFCSLYIMIGKLKEILATSTISKCVVCCCVPQRRSL